MVSVFNALNLKINIMINNASSTIPNGNTYLNHLINKPIPTDFNFNDFFKTVEENIKSLGFSIQSKDQSRPWGGFLVIDESQEQQFIELFFNQINPNDLRIAGKLSPKILIVKPLARLSWQYHNRRAEIWQVISGEAGIIRSHTDVQGQIKRINKGDQILLEQGERHRLIGLNEYCIVAEIWRHTNKNHPSNEEDIIRVQDDFGR